MRDYPRKARAFAANCLETSVDSYAAYEKFLDNYRDADTDEHLVLCEIFNDEELKRANG